MGISRDTWAQLWGLVVTAAFTLGVGALIAGYSWRYTGHETNGDKWVRYGWIGIIIGVVGLIVGFLILYATRPKQRNESISPLRRMLKFLRRIRIVTLLPSEPEIAIEGSARNDSTIPAQFKSRVRLQLEDVGWAREAWVRLRVVNKGPAEEFKVVVTSMYYVDAPGSEKHVQYSVKWREGKDDLKRVVGDDLLDLAQIVLPRQTNIPMVRYQLGAPQQAPPMKGEAEFARGYFRLFSVTQPEGWQVYAKRKGALLSVFDDINTVPPEDRPVLVFDEELTLYIRVDGASGQKAEAKVILGFEKPAWDFDRHEWGLGSPTAKLIEGKYNDGT
jgi:hypothetical protein